MIRVLNSRTDSSRRNESITGGLKTFFFTGVGASAPGAVRLTTKARIAAALFLAVLFAGLPSVKAAGGIFPKMPSSTSAVRVDWLNESTDAKRTMYCFQGLINQTSAKIFIPSRTYDMEHLTNSGKPYTRMTQAGGSNSGVRSLFRDYSSSVQRMYIYDPAKDWTFYLALMAGAQNQGIPVTASLQTQLVAQVPGWSGTVVDYRNIGTDRVSGYQWALANLMPGCTKKVVFVVKNLNLPLFDYAVASKGFISWLDLANTQELAVQDAIFATAGYGVGTVMMGYNGDGANILANAYGIGYTPSDFYSNGSFWSSFPNKTYTQPRGEAITAQKGKVYVALVWSDGDNLQFDQLGAYQLWKQATRGLVPVATSLSPGLQEIDPCLLDRYYALKTTNDELVAGPSGFQFMYLNEFKTNNNALVQWSQLNKVWCADAGFHSASVWKGTYPSSRYTTYATNSGLDSILHHYNGISNPQFEADTVIINECNGDSWTPTNLYASLANVAANANAPVFTTGKMIVQGFNTNGGYGGVTNVVAMLNRAYPGKYVFISHGSLAATIKAYYLSYAGYMYLTNAATLQVENYDNGGEGQGYHDTTTGNSGGQYRTNDVDISVCSQGGYCVTDTRFGEWLKYTCNVPVNTDGQSVYNITLWAANANSARFVQLFQDNVLKATFRVPSTGGAQNWTNIVVTGVVLKSGLPSRFRLQCVTDYVNLDKLVFTMQILQKGSTMHAEDYDNRNDGKANGWYDTTAGNSGNCYRWDDVDIQPRTDATGGFTVFDTKTSEWMEYTRKILGNTYTLTLHAANAASGTTKPVEFYQDGVLKATFNVTYTGGEQVWQTFAVSNVVLSAKTTSVLKLKYNADSVKVDKLLFN